MTRTTLLVAAVAALLAVLVAASGLAGTSVSQVLLAFGAMLALTLFRAPKRN